MQWNAMQGLELCNAVECNAMQDLTSEAAQSLHMPSGDTADECEVWDLLV